MLVHSNSRILVGQCNHRIDWFGILRPQRREHFFLPRPHINVSTERKEFTHRPDVYEFCQVDMELKIFQMHEEYN